MEVIKKYKSQFRFHLLLNSSFGLFITFASYYHIPVAAFTDFGFYFAHFICLQFSIFGFLYFLSLNKHFFRVVFPIVFLLLSGTAFWVYFQDITISHSIIQVSFETKMDIMMDLITFPFILYVLLAITTVIFILKYYSKINNNKLKSPLTLLAILAIFSYFMVEDYQFGTFNRRLPYNILVSTREYLEQNPLLLKPVNYSVKTNCDSLSVVFILGESVRADHLQLNGYPRKTNPLLSQRNDIISFLQSFPEQSLEIKYIHFMIYESAFKSVFEGEDRKRF